MPARDSRLLLIHPEDNVYVLTHGVQAGEELEIAGHSVHAASNLGLGHKLAARSVAAGEKIVKYGLPIGTATRDIERGEHVHTHNMRSDYLPTYTHEAGEEFGEES